MHNYTYIKHEMSTYCISVHEEMPRQIKPPQERHTNSCFQWVYSDLYWAWAELHYPLKAVGILIV